MTTILLVEDEAPLRSYLTQELTFADYTVISAPDGPSAWQISHEQVVDVILLDWMLPGRDGLSLLKAWRKETQVPIIFMTARDYVSDKVTALDYGADDYITKPFDIEELLARLRVVLRHQQLPTANQLTVGDLTLHVKSLLVQRGDEQVQLTPREGLLLSFFMQNVGQIFTRDELLDEVWQDNYDRQPNLVDVYVRYLRHKIDEQDAPSRIETLRGVGYRFVGSRV